MGTSMAPSATPAAAESEAAAPGTVCDRTGPVLRRARLVVLVSGAGSNLLALLEACEEPSYGAQVVAVLADRACAGCDHAARAGVPAQVVAPGGFPDRPHWDQALARAVAAWEPDLVVCAGFMRLLGPGFLERFPGRVVNTHPSLLPDFPGAHAVRDTLAAGADRSGATLFWVDEGVDTGEHIAQVEVEVLPGDTEETLTQRIKAAETPQLVAHVGRLAREMVRGEGAQGAGAGADPEVAQDV
ncbi:phosphoribosylglycinamide formyltransferase [Actinomyces wuliandei]|uniref:phosphoribosylglycinamide formyltransferase n=1 Tax=Actinomyces wuliandei TaxID=2057743 RepID=UPI00214AACD3|nr:phosphoribosylglycinamide formyltransferase [Actinomyces wuliandei]